MRVPQHHDGARAQHRLWRCVAAAACHGASLRYAGAGRPDRPKHFASWMPDSGFWSGRGPVGARVSTEGGRMHIILVEDDPQLGAAIQRALERLAYTVSWLRDGRAALLALRDQTADLVLLDLGLPGKDGLDVLVETRRSHVTTPVIVMTARDGLDDRVRGLDAGADDYLVKPFHVDELAARIRSLTRRAQGLAANR